MDANILELILSSYVKAEKIVKTLSKQGSNIGKSHQSFFFWYETPHIFFFKYIIFIYINIINP